MALDLKPHKFKVDPRTGMARLDKVMPYKMYTRRVPGGSEEVFLQNGVYYYRSGDVVPDAELRRMGLDPEFGPDGETVPKSMSEHPAMKAIVEAEQVEAIRANSAPVRTVVVSSKG